MKRQLKYNTMWHDRTLYFCSKIFFFIYLFISVFKRSVVCFAFSCVWAPFCLSLVRCCCCCCCCFFLFLSFLACVPFCACFFTFFLLLFFSLARIFLIRSGYMPHWMPQYGIWFGFFVAAVVAAVAGSVIVDTYYYACLLACLFVCHGL